MPYIICFRFHIEGLACAGLGLLCDLPVASATAWEILQTPILKNGRLKVNRCLSSYHLPLPPSTPFPARKLPGFSRIQIPPTVICHGFESLHLGRFVALAAMYTRVAITVFSPSP